MPLIKVTMRSDRVAPKTESFTFNAWDFRVEPSGALTVVDQNGRPVAAFQADVWEHITIDPSDAKERRPMVERV